MGRTTTAKVVCVCLKVKIGRRLVYLHHTPGTPIQFVDAVLSLGPDEENGSYVCDFLNRGNLDKSTRRKIRKALSAAGRPDIAAYSVMPKIKSLKKMYANVPY